jgi:D-tyrosyl-tRNA(Tyr) deacylase
MGYHPTGQGGVGLRLVLQRVEQASVRVDSQTVATIGPGLLIFVGVGTEDVPAAKVSPSLERSGSRETGHPGQASKKVAVLANKVATLRIFPDESGRSNLSLLDIRGSALVISQFTLYADTRRGRRPSFTDAAEPGPAEALVEEFRRALEALEVPTAAGRFGAHMTVTLVNDGPYTVVLDSEK